MLRSYFNQIKERYTTFVAVILVLLLISIVALPSTQSGAMAAETENQKSNSSQELKITDWSFVAAWGMSTMHNVTIENTSDVTYKDIKVSLDYYVSNNLTKPIRATIVLPVTVPAHSKNTYLKKGIPGLLVNPGGVNGMYSLAEKIEVIQAAYETAVGANLQSSAKDASNYKLSMR